MVMERQLDELVQTAQDYSIEVVDPDADATEPDEWYHYFNRWGRVKYVTITKKNSSLKRLLSEKHHILKRLDSNKVGILPRVVSIKQFHQQETLINRLGELEIKLAEAYLQRCDACRVYVTFETEEEQQAVLRDLEVPDIEAILDRPVAHSKAFRGRNILNIVEPAEPDNMIWENTEISLKYVDNLTYSSITFYSLFARFYYSYAVYISF
jgi:hypothetical protein